MSLAFASAEEGIFTCHKEVIDNGATIIARYVPESPLVTVQVRVLSGLSNEGRYAGSGISHFLEHLLFKGTKDRTSGEVFREVRRLGGVTNGSTGLDSAEYHITVPVENFEEGLKLITDMVMGLEFSDEDMATERDVILKEIRLHKDNPESRMVRELFGQAYTKQIYKYPIIGHLDRFNSLTREDLAEYHRSKYNPDRIVLGIAGGVPTEQAVAAAEKHLGSYKRGEASVDALATEPAQLGQRTVQFPVDTNLGYMAIGFHTTSLFSDELYAMDVASILLGEGRGSRLYQRLVVEKELLYTVSCSNLTPRYPGLFIVTCTGEPEKLDEAKEEIFAIIDGFEKQRIRSVDLERSKNIVMSHYLHLDEDIESMVSNMTVSEILTGDPYFYDKYVEGIKNVDTEDIKTSVSRYLKRDNSTTVMLVPGAFVKERISREENRDTAQDEEISSSLDNGLKVVIKRRPRLPIAAVCMAFPGGLRSEDAADNGISNLTAAMVLKGTKKRSEDQIVPVLESMGGSIGAFSGNNSFGVAMDVLSGDIEKGLDIFSDVIKNPVFPEDEIDKQKKKIEASIRQKEKKIFSEGVFQMRKLLYGSHPYSMRPQGSIDTLKKLSRDDVVKFHEGYFTPGGAVITVVGDVDVEDTLEMIRSRFKGWRGDPSDIKTEGVKPLSGVVSKELTMAKEQSLVLIGFQGVDVYDDKKYTLLLTGTMLSGGGGILFEEIRENQGIAYSCGAISVALVDPGYFVVYIKTTEENVDKAKSSAFDILKRIREGDFTEEDVLSSKNTLLTTYASGLETNSSLAIKIVLDDLYGLGYGNYKRFPDMIKKVTREDIIDCAKEILDPERCAVVVIRSSKGEGEAYEVPETGKD